MERGRARVEVAEKINGVEVQARRELRDADAAQRSGRDEVERLAIGDRDAQYGGAGTLDAEVAIGGEHPGADGNIGELGVEVGGLERNDGRAGSKMCIRDRSSLAFSFTS